MRETLSLLCWHHWRRSFWNGHYRRLIGLWGWKVITSDTWADFVNIWFHLFGRERGWGWSNDEQRHIRAYYRVTPTMKKLPLQWWVQEGHWSKTTWKNVLLGWHRGQQLKLGRP